MAHRDSGLIGKSAVDAGFPKEFVGKGKAVINGVKGYYQSEEYEGQIIGTFMPSKEYYAARRNQTLAVSLSMLIIFGILLFMINRMVGSKIVQGINNITNSMKKIADGDFGITVDEQGNPEFMLLSSSINKMVENIGRSIEENEGLLEQQKEDMQHTQAMIENIKDACKGLNHASSETLENADSIYQGTGKQEEAVAGLKQIMNQLIEELNSSVNASSDVAQQTESTVDKIQQTQSRMELLENSMQEIGEMSMEIEKIIDEINSIAQQTNMLSLNASIEAARAGEMGKGFAVVATQVGELASRSTQAAKETNELITNSMKAVESGQEITVQTAKAFHVVVENIEKAIHAIDDIANMVKRNVKIVDDAVSQIERISSVVDENVQISSNTKQVSANMAEVAGRLLEIVE